jgi:transcription elongation GreA/GreB family factor
MSRAFIKDDDEAPDEPLPERPISEHPNYVTPSGLAQLEARREKLEAERLELARRADADDSARERLRYVERDLRYCRRRLDAALMVDPEALQADAVGFGATVTVLEGSGEQRNYTIVGEDEADPDAGLVSWVSPLARVLEGARMGERAVWRRPAGPLELTVVAIEYRARRGGAAETAENAEMDETTQTDEAAETGTMDEAAETGTTDGAAETGTTGDLS